MNKKRKQKDIKEESTVVEDNEEVSSNYGLWGILCINNKLI